MTRRDLPKYVYLRGRNRAPWYCPRGTGKDAPKTRMLCDPGSTEFYAEYARLRAGAAPVAREHSWRYLIDNYRGSDRFTRRKPRTQADYNTVLDFLAAKIGTLDPRKMRRVDVARIRDQNRETVRFANYCVQVLRVVFEHAIEIGWRDDNPAKGVLLLEVPAERKQPHIVWTDDAVAKFREKAKPLPRLIFELGVGTVQRPGDLVRFDWEDFDGTCLRLRQGKTGKVLVLPCTDHLLTALANAPRPKVMPIGRRPILWTGRGRRMSYRMMAQIMLAERQRLKVEQHDLHALRYRGVQELAWAGCSDDEITSYSGHDTKAMVEKYAGDARQIMRARQAKEKRL